MPGHK